jgi:hypothetical protein
MNKATWIKCHILGYHTFQYSFDSEMTDKQKCILEIEQICKYCGKSKFSKRTKRKLMELNNID